MLEQLSPNFLLGADPEFFCKDVETNKYVSLIPYLKGTKKKPHSIGVEGCFDLIDNVSIEFNMPPVPEYWMLNNLITDCVDYTNNWLKSINPNFVLEPVSSAEFDQDQLKHKAARTFGCDPAFSIYDWKGEVYRPSPMELGGLRTASYHIHYGFEEEYNADTLRHFMLLNDVFLGFPALFLDKSDKLRKKAYGSLSEHRLKHPSTDNYYDIEKTNRVEYRTLGAGIHKYPEFVNNGINLIRKNISNLENFVNEYYEDFKILNQDLENTKVINSLKNKLKLNNHWNEYEK